MTNFKITGKAHESKKGHYVVERDHALATEHELHRLEKKLDKHMALPMERAHRGTEQPQAGIPALRK